MLVPTIEREHAPSTKPRPGQQQAAPERQASKGGSQRRAWLVAAAVVVAVISIAAVIVPAPPPAVVVRTRTGLIVLDESSGATKAVVPAGQISPDATVMANANADDADGTTAVAATSATTGRRLWSTQLHGSHHVRLVGHGGRVVVVAPGKKPVGGLYAPPSRTRTEFTVVRPSRSKTYSLWGNFEPEAVSLDGRSLFLIKYTPPMDPQSYQVRRMDLTTGEVVDVFTPDEELQQEMGGTARTQIASTDGRRLYTLYTLSHDDGTADAFIHVLSLDGLWAHCIHLPSEFTGAARSTALALSPAGGRLYVVDGIAGRVVAIDTDSLQVGAGSPAPIVAEQQPVFAAADGTSVYVAANSHVHPLAADTLRMSDAYAVKAEITALHAAGPGVVHLGVVDGGERRLDTVDLESGRVIDTQPSPLREPITGFGTTPPTLPQQRQNLMCAC